MRVWDWAKANVERFQKTYGKDPRWSNIIDQRNRAALEFYRLTGDPKWHTRFVKDSVLTAPKPRLAKNSSAKNQGHSQQDTAFLDARPPNGLGEARSATAARCSTPLPALDQTRHPKPHAMPTIKV